MMEDQIINIMDSVFECTLDMINKDFSEYPEHRVEFFKLLRTINLRCFPALLRLDARSFKFVIDSCMWASKHDNREVESAGLSMCFELVSNMSETDPQTCNAFFKMSSSWSPTAITRLVSSHSLHFLRSCSGWSTRTS